MFVLLLITDDHIDVIRWNTAVAFPSLQMTSFVTSPSSLLLLFPPLLLCIGNLMIKKIKTRMVQLPATAVIEYVAACWVSGAGALLSRGSFARE